MLISLVYPVLVAPAPSDLTPTSRSHLHKHAVPSPFHASPVYIDSIGVPRGVPDEFKLVDQVAAGFENIPLLSALFPVTPNKNVDRINYLHYNQQRLANFTRDGFDAVHEQLSATSLVALQAFQGVDMLMAEKGGICSMFGDQCCTYIPNNTAPDGKLTKTLHKLRALSDELKSHSGVDSSLWQPFTDFFGKWSGLVGSVLASIAVFTALLVCCGCCCIPCARSLCNRLITVAIEKRDLSSAPPPYQMVTYSPSQEPPPDSSVPLPLDTAL